MRIQHLAVFAILSAASLLPALSEEGKENTPRTSNGDLAALRSRMQSAIETSMAKAAVSFPESLIYLEAEARKLQAEFPERPEPLELLISAATFSDPKKGRSLAEEVVSSKVATAELTSTASGLIKNLEAVGKPFVIKFRAQDGRAVDSETLKGKVVLIDFWATWCPPCLALLPHLKTTYEQLAPQGFEIIGISYDDDGEKLASFVRREKILWPQSL